MERNNLVDETRKKGVANIKEMSSQSWLFLSRHFRPFGTADPRKDSNQENPVELNLVIPTTLNVLRFYQSLSVV